MSEIPAPNPNTQPVRIDAPTAGELTAQQPAVQSPLQGERQLGSYQTPDARITSMALPGGDKVTKVTNTISAADFHRRAGVDQDYERLKAQAQELSQPPKLLGSRVLAALFRRG